MDGRLRMARELVGIARMLVARDYVHKPDYTDADEEERYAKNLAYSVREHFKNDELETPLVDYTLKVNPRHYLKQDAKHDCQRRFYDVRIILMYVDKVEQSDLPCPEAKEEFLNGPGGGGAFTDDKSNLVIVANGSTEEDWCRCEQYFEDIVRHEMMHILDHIAYPYAFGRSENYGKLTKHEKRRNKGVAYPVGNADMLDPKYAEYFTCENEIREYRSDLRNEIGRWCRREGIEWKDAISQLKQMLGNERKLRNFIETYGDGNSSPYVTLYHLSFSHPSHGDRNTALKMLNGLREPD